jgi:glycosyltransferase involved in cell wall biosynthesis
VREALAMARPVVSTDVAGNRELVRNGKTGLLTPAKDPLALAEAMSRLLTDYEDAARLGAAGRKLVLELCTDEARATKVEQLYRELLAERAR